MIEINLLSDELKQTRAQRLRDKKFPVTLILLSLNGVLFSVLLIVSSVSIARFTTLRALETRLRGLAPEQQKIMGIIKSSSDLKSKNAFYNQLSSEGFLWSETLNKLSGLIVPGIWFRQMQMLEPRVASTTGAPGKGVEPPPPRVLKVSATAVSVAGDEMAVINEFIKKVKEDTAFMKHFKNIELESVMRRQISSVDVMDFTLLCSFNESVVW